MIVKNFKIFFISKDLYFFLKINQKLLRKIILYINYEKYFLAYQKIYFIIIYYIFALSIFFSLSAHFCKSFLLYYFLFILLIRINIHKILTNKKFLPFTLAKI